MKALASVEGRFLRGKKDALPHMKEGCMSEKERK
jgi:hypothetical protein